MSQLSRRSLVTSAAALPALAVPALAAPGSVTCTLPPDLIERFVRVRARFLEDHARGSRHSAEIDRRLYATAGVTKEQYRELKFGDPGYKELMDLHSKIFREVCGDEEVDEYGETEADRMTHERWEVAQEMLEHWPQTVADLAWQTEAYLLADLELFGRPNHRLGSDEYILRLLMQNIRKLGALPRPADPFGALVIGFNEGEGDDNIAVQ